MVNAHRKSEALPGFYALPWQTGRPMAGKVAMSRMTEHHSGWVYAAVRAIAQGCAACDIRFTASRARGRTRGRLTMPSGGPGQPSPEAAPTTHAAESPRSLPLTDDHPLLGLFAHVNPFRTYRELLESTVTDLELFGNAYWVMARNRVSGVPGEIWPVPPAWMKVVPSSRSAELIEAYELRRAGRTTRFDPRDVVHFRYPSPSDPFYGASPLEAAIEAVYADESVARAQRRTFENGPVPGVVLKTREPLTPVQVERLRAQFESRFSGPDAAGRLVITHEGAEIFPFTTSPREMDFIDSARATRDRILGVFGVPPAVLGLVEDFNRANAEAAQMLFARDTLQPKLKLIAARITQDVCSQFLPEGISCRFESPVPQDREANRLDMATGVRLGILTPNEARADFYGKRPIDGGDVARPVATAPLPRHEEHPER